MEDDNLINSYDPYATYSIDDEGNLIIDSNDYYQRSIPAVKALSDQKKEPIKITIDKSYLEEKEGNGKSSPFDPDLINFIEETVKKLRDREMQKRHEHFKQIHDELIKNIESGRINVKKKNRF